MPTLILEDMDLDLQEDPSDSHDWTSPLAEPRAGAQKTNERMNPWKLPRCDRRAQDTGSGPDLVEEERR